MTMPNLASSFSLVGAAEFSAATPPVVTNAVNVSGVTRTNAGIWVLTIVDPCDENDRFVSLTGLLATHITLVLDPAIQTDTTIGILGFALAIAADTAAFVKIERTHLTPS